MLEALESLHIAKLKAFTLTYELGSFASAAHQQGKHSSTFSRRVTNLELDLGVELFERNGVHLTPTEEAKALYQPAKSLISEAEHFSQRVELCLAKNETTLSVAIDSALQCFAPDEVISQVLQEFPATEVNVRSGNTAQVMALVEQQQVDVGLALSCFNTPSTMMNNKLFKFDIQRVMAPSYAEKIGWMVKGEIEPAFIRSMTQIVLSPLNELGVNTQNYSSRLVNVDNFSMAKSLVLGGVGWSNLPKQECQAELESGALIAFKGTHEGELEWSVDALWPIEKPTGPVAQKLVELFVANADRLVLGGK
ncbi:LysR family transcriptional regulator [Vibrio sp. SCSIO 43136]|uniref:LysR family transcriptional regulator n=1 Tax=Vibrio sp. SCSIO 43136 TaxID=2819101 RepID=UPI002076474D|nr:LysR family transcriptional regulator [Vibrio sp. SCSIO 43136]USD67421.1 LysR family transcriptional regulator [Vibrio sp. SCSIO 43136]